MKDISTSVPAITVDEHRALRALAAGEAAPHQQTLALSVIVKKLAQPQDLLYVPGSFDQTAFLNGRAFVASRIRYYVAKEVKDV